MGKRKRYVVDIPLNKPNDFVDFILKDFLEKKGFFRANYEGVSVWQCGNGVLVAPKFLYCTYVNGILHIEAWLKFAWLPGVYSGEMNLEGFYGWAVKSAYKKDIEQLIQLLQQPLPQDRAYVNASSQPNTQPQQGINMQSPQPNANVQPQQQNPYVAPTQVKVQVFDNHKQANLGFILGLVAIGLTILNIILVLLADRVMLSMWIIFIAIAGIVNSAKGINSSKKGQAICGLILSIISTILALMLFILVIISIFMI